MRRLAVVAAVLAGVLAAAPSGHAASWRHYRVKDPAQTLRRINALRTAMGASAVREVPAWSTGCARHIAYTMRNAMGHEETPGRPGYTRTGAAAGMSSVLFWPPREPFTRHDPSGGWSQAPYHQLQVLDPRMTRTGFSLGCMATLRGLSSSEEPASGIPRLVGWPADGATRVPTVIDACAERPSDPFTDVGWSCGGVGVALYVYALDAGSGNCLEASDTPEVTVTSRGRKIPLQVVEGAACGWIAVTGRRLPRAARVTMTATVDGAVLQHAFTTRG